MASPSTLVVGHCTSTTANIFCAVPAGTAPGMMARLHWSANGKAATLDLPLQAAGAYRVGVFKLTGLPPAAVVTYAVDTAPAPAALATSTVMFAAGTHSFRLLPDKRPPRVAFVSCNGTYAFTPEERRFVVWKKLKHHIDAGDVDMVVHGGDQIYADVIWMKHDNDHTNRGLTPSQTERVAALADQYRGLYLKTWGAPEVAAVLASVPNAMTWDDHDVYDGWGSHDDDDHGPQQAFFAAARQAYSEFQVSHSAGPVDPASSFLRAWTHGRVGFLLLDTRSNRMWNRSRVLGDAQIAAAKAWVDANAKGLKRLYVVSSIPLVHASVAAALALLKVWPGTEEIEDDLRDSWVASNNRNECQRLVKWLFGVQAANPGLQVTVLGGDVHVAALAEIRSKLPAHLGGGQVPPRIFQVTSSGIGTPPPSGITLKLMKLATGGEIELGTPDIVGRLVRINGSRDVILAQRNFVVLNLEDNDKPGEWEPRGNLRVDYFVERGDDCDLLPQILNGPG
ncbi:MAG TPA: alkaline phosphatase D family protein [Longimicrobiaceae bacterium]|jgi:hypothetical protein|nr:alkaline phosphatase D family protein [Longimicrobiaceae bacterium]